MERFENQSIHFFDNGTVFDLAGFRPHPDFDKLFPFISTVRPPDWAHVKPTADQNDDERTTTNTTTQEDTRKLATPDLRIIFTDE